MIRLHELDNESISIQQTIPFAGFVNEYDGYPGFVQPLAIELVPPSNVNKSCEDKSIIYKRCRKEVQPLPFDERHNYKTDENWNTIISFPIYAKQSDIYDIPDSEVTLLLRTSLVGGIESPRRGNLIFHNVELEKVIVSTLG